jgi:hypothetical protein
MSIRLVLFAALSCSTACAHGVSDTPPARSSPASGEELRPVTVEVVDRDSDAPVTRFSYDYRYDTAGRSVPRKEDWRAIESPTGTVEIRVPSACRLSVGVKAPDYIGGYPLFHEFVIKSTDASRRVVVKLRRGITVQGIVRDDRTNQPVVGATVAPVIHVLPIWVPDEDRKVTTGKDGRYEVRGVDPDLGVSAYHPDYINDLPFPQGQKVGAHHDIALSRGIAVSGAVLDANGKPIDGVQVTALNGRGTRTARDGTFRLANPDLTLGLDLYREGYISKKIDREAIRRELSDKGMIVVALETVIPFEGRVLAPDGRPVEAFTVAAGPGRLPRQSDSRLLNVRDASGRFAMGLERSGTTWVGVRADGYAPWEGWAEVSRGGATLTIRLSTGVTLSGKVVVPDDLGRRVSVSVVPRRDKSEIGGLPAMPYSEGFGARILIATEDGSFRFERMRPDRYALRLSGRGFPDRALAVDVPEGGIDTGPIRIEIPPRGRIVGRVFRPKSRGGGVWAFADGGVSSPYIKDAEDDPLGIRGMKFRADEEGRFTVENVPAGLVTVSFPFQVFDVIHSVDLPAVVVAGRTTSVSAFDPEAKRELPIEFAIGDGSPAQVASGTGFAAARQVENVTATASFFARARGPSRKPMFRVELIPRSTEPLTFAEPDWKDLDGRRRIILPDVGPGKYRLRLYDWLGLRDLDSGPVFDQEIVVPPATPTVRVPLGAGCITGKVPVSDNFDRHVEVIAVSRPDGATIRRGRCDDKGNYCVRYLDPGSYTVFIRDPTKGFCRVEDVRVPAGAIDLGERRLSPGATVHGTIAFRRPCPMPGQVIATGPSGETLTFRFEVYSSFDGFAFANLWPGRWSFAAFSGETKLGTGQAEVSGTEQVSVSIASTAGG